MRRFIVILSLLSLAAAVGAMEGDSLWSHTYGGTGFDKAYVIHPTEDGGFLLGGVTTSFQPGSSDTYWLKVDSVGNLLWQQSYSWGGGLVWDEIKDIAATADGGFMLAGIVQWEDYPVPYSDLTLLKINSSGSVVWNHIYPQISTDMSGATAIVPSGDGNFMMTGFSDYGGIKMLLLKINPSGALLWWTSYGFPAPYNNSSMAFDLTPTSDGGYILVGYCGSTTSAAIKVDSGGNTIWRSVYELSQSSWDELIFSIVPAENGNFLLAGYIQLTSSNYSRDFLAIKINADGDTLWTRHYGTLNNEEGYSVFKTSDGNFLIAGWTNTNISGSDDVYLVKINTNGDTLWTHSYGGNGTQQAYSALQAADGDYRIAGYTSASVDVWLLNVQGPALSPVSITLAPLNPPITIPSTGGSFNFNVSVERNVGPQAPYTVWARIKNPDGTYTAPTLGPISINTPVGVTITRQRTQTIPGSWPAGGYTYLGYANTTFAYPAIDSSSFTFTKSTARDGGATGDGTMIWEATCTGEPFPGEEFPPLLRGDRGDFVRLSASPLPFNPTTTICYELQAASHVSLKVYDTTGRLVQTLVEASMEAGEHQVMFEGSDLPSGIYLARLQAGEFTAVQKLVLMK